MAEAFNEARLEQLALAIAGTAVFEFAETHDGFSQPAQLPSAYVWPATRGRIGDNARVALISAAGAMGKSVAAAAVAAHSRALLLDTAKVRVGSNTISGGLAKALGAQQYGKFLDELGRGVGALVIDGVDEALLFSGFDHFSAFLDDLVWLCDQAGSGLVAVVLGRADAIDTVQLHLEDRLVEVARLELTALAYGDSCTFIDQYLDLRPAEGREISVHRDHAVPFGELRDLVLFDIGRALDPDFIDKEQWELVRDFVGYPAVLQAVAERLAVSNPAAEAAELRGSHSSTRANASGMTRGSLLLEVCRRVVEREREKVALHVGNALGLRPEDPLRSVLYLEEEQVTRLLAAHGAVADEVVAPASLPDDERAKYDELIRGFVVDHPFLRGRSFANVVFADYVRAFAVSSPLAGARRIQLEAARLDVGPFFAHFLAALCVAVGSEAAALPVPDEFIDHVVRSARLSHPRSVWRYTQSSSRPGLLEVFLEGAGDSDPLRFTAPASDEMIVLTSPLSYGEFIADQDVYVSGPANEVRLGPGLFMQARSLYLDAEQIRIAPRRSAGHEGAKERSGFGVYLVAEQSIGTPARAKVIPLEEDCLRVGLPAPTYPWTPYYYSPPGVSLLIDVNVWHRSLALTRRALSSLHALSNGRIGAAEESLRRYLAVSEHGEAVFDALRELGVLSIDGSYVVLELDALANHGVGYGSLAGDNPHRQLEPLVAAMFSTSALAKYRKPVKGT